MAAFDPVECLIEESQCVSVNLKITLNSQIQRLQRNVRFHLSWVKLVPKKKIKKERKFSVNDLPSGVVQGGTGQSFC